MIKQSNNVNDFDYGQLYYDYLINKELETKSIPINDESQKVYSLIPYNHQYDNRGKICKQLNIISTELFFESPNFLNFVQSFSYIQKRLVNEEAAIKPHIYKAGTPQMLNKYSLSSEFILGKDISKDILNVAKGLQNEDKASMILIIGGHAVNILMHNQNNKVGISYFDPYKGQIFMQTVTMIEIEKVLEGNMHFIHPKSILNPHNALLGEISIYNSSILDTSVPFIFRTLISKINTNNDSKHEITLAENVKMQELIKFLGHTPNIFDMMLYSSEKTAFSKFLKQYSSKILEETAKVKFCAAEIFKCSKYLGEIVSDAYKNLFDDSYNSLESSISNNYKNSLFEDRFKSLPSSLKKLEKICIKEVENLSTPSNAVTNFYKIQLDDKIALNITISKCTAQPGIKFKKEIAKSICDNYSDIDPNIFTNAHKVYYNYIDNLYPKNYKENCYDLNNFDNNLHKIGITNDLLKYYDEL